MRTDRAKIQGELTKMKLDLTREHEELKKSLNEVNQSRLDKEKLTKEISIKEAERSHLKAKSLARYDFY